VGSGDAGPVGAGGLLLTGGSGVSATGGGEVGVGTGGVTQAQVGLGAAGRTGARPRTARPLGGGAAPRTGGGTARLDVGLGTEATPRAVGDGDGAPATDGNRFGGAASSLASALRPFTTAK
jgi:hypothetical protein